MHLEHLGFVVQPEPTPSTALGYARMAQLSAPRGDLEASARDEQPAARVGGMARRTERHQPIEIEVGAPLGALDDVVGLEGAPVALLGRNLCRYPDEELRAQALATVAVESPRGFRLAKGTAGRKIDGIVALSLACIAALDEPAEPPPLTDAQVAGMECQERAVLRSLRFRPEPEPYGGWDNVVVAERGVLNR